MRSGRSRRGARCRVVDGVKGWVGGGAAQAVKAPAVEGGCRKGSVVEGRAEPAVEGRGWTKACRGGAGRAVERGWTVEGWGLP